LGAPNASRHVNYVVLIFLLSENAKLSVPLCFKKRQELLAFTSGLKANQALSKQISQLAKKFHC
jgi:hypothetical protein